jgi:hypothetical protein
VAIDAKSDTAVIPTMQNAMIEQTKKNPLSTAAAGRAS